MAIHVDFSELKTKVGIEQVVDLLGLPLKKSSGDQLRGTCALCGNDGRKIFVVTPAKGLFHSFCCKKGGDMIRLYSEVKHVGQKEAAEAIHAHFLGSPAAV